MTEPADQPNFATWQHDTLAKFAAEVYAKLQAEQGVLMKNLKEYA